MRRILPIGLVTMWSTAAWAAAPVESVATPTLGESALLLLAVGLPLLGARSLHQRIVRPGL